MTITPDELAQSKRLEEAATGTGTMSIERWEYREHTLTFLPRLREAYEAQGQELAWVRKELIAIDRSAAGVAALVQYAENLRAAARALVAQAENDDLGWCPFCVPYGEHKDGCSYAALKSLVEA